MRRHPVAAVERRVHPHAEAAGRVVIADLAGRRHEAAWMFGVDAAFDGVAVEGNLVLAERQDGAGRDL